MKIGRLKNMKREITIIAVIVVVGINLVGCNSSERAKLRGESVPSVSREQRGFRAMPDPSAVYCTRLGYKYEIVADGIRLQSLRYQYG